jgi:hypothetical protein
MLVGRAAGWSAGQKGARWRVGVPPSIQVPRTVQTVLGARIDRLAPEVWDKAVDYCRQALRDWYALLA